MIAKPKIERRQVQHRALALAPSFLFAIPSRIAWPTILALLALTALGEAIMPGSIFFGPVYLAIIALTAWTIRARTALVLGLIILASKLATGTMHFYPAGGGIAYGNIAVRIAGVAIVVAFIGLARKSCEREWQSARTDLLTGTLNRQAFFEIVEKGLCSGGWSALIYADLDGLKALNDREGHAQGDQSLKDFVEIAGKAIRKGDVFARMGGDEFVIFMKLKDEESGTAVGKRLHKTFNAEHGGDGLRLTCSLGVLLLPEGSKTIDAELRVADELMYKAKQTRCGVFVGTGLATDDGDVALAQPLDLFGQAVRERSVRRADRAVPDEAAVNPSQAA